VSGVKSTTRFIAFHIVSLMPLHRYYYLCFSHMRSDYILRKRFLVFKKLLVFICTCVMWTVACGSRKACSGGGIPQGSGLPHTLIQTRHISDNIRSFRDTSWYWGGRCHCFYMYFLGIGWLCLALNLWCIFWNNESRILILVMELPIFDAL